MTLELLHLTTDAPSMLRPVGVALSSQSTACSCPLISSTHKCIKAPGEDEATYTSIPEGLTATDTAPLSSLRARADTGCREDWFWSGRVSNPLLGVRLRTGIV